MRLTEIGSFPVTMFFCCFSFFQGYGNKGITLYDIRAELSCRYKDLRAPYRPPNTEEVFNMLTKETPETFYIGKYYLNVFRYYKGS